MIRIVQRIIVLIFVASVALFAATSWKIAEVRDTDGPEISMDKDSITTSISCTSEDILAGVKATDRRDGDVTDSLVVQGMSNFIDKGRRQATLAAFDSDNNVSKVIREVIYEDYVSPRFALKGPLRFTTTEATASMDAICAMFTATDCLDGDLSTSIIMSSADNIYWPDSPGAYEMLFQVSNSAGDVAELKATMEVYDPEEDGNCPWVELSEYLIYVNTGEKVKPMDFVEGIVRGSMTYSLDDLGEEDAEYSTDDISIYNPVDENTPGVYEIVYSMDGEDDSHSNIRLIVIVE